MVADKKQFQNIDEYVRSFPKDVQRILEEIRSTIRKTAPKAAEVISYQIPTFKLNGVYLVHFAAWKSHIALYPVPRGAKDLPELLPYIKGKGTLQFSLDKPIPYDLVKKIVLLRIQEKAPGGK